MPRRYPLALILALCGAAAAPGAVRAQSPVVVELFTAQGCAACPPADAFLAELATRADVIALALHVDYWDYIGWRDTFAQGAFTERQKAYARAAGARTIYTPQMVVQGREAMPGTRTEAVTARILEMAAAPQTISLEASSRADGARLVLRPLAGPVGGARVHLVRYEPRVDVAIGAGENAGRRLEGHNIVLSWETLAEWDGSAPLELEVALPGSLPAVAIVQRADQGAILGALRLR
ncbi:MAG: DUF1223 domain-containing protein [Gemmobacter sp.]